MRRREHSDPPPLRAATLTLLMAAVVICMALLAVLCLATARADKALADRQLQTLTRQAEAEMTGQQWLADAEAALQDGTALPAGTNRQDGTLTTELPLESGTLYITARDKDGHLAVTDWQIENDWQPAEGNTLWGG